MGTQCQEVNFEGINMENLLSTRSVTCPLFINLKEDNILVIKKLKKIYIIILFVKTILKTFEIKK